MCNIASISFSNCVTSAGVFGSKGALDLDKLKFIAKVDTRNFNQVIDGNFYHVEEANKSISTIKP